MSNLPALQTEKVSPHIQGNEVSLYSGSLNNECLLKSIALIKKAFPALPIDFYEVLIDRIKDNGFTDQRLIDSVNFVIDNCPYPTPTIHHFISFDRKYKYLTYDQMLAKSDEFGKEIWDSYKPVKLQSDLKPVWVHVNDIAKYNIKSEA
jgi:hypothetical protein